MLCSRHTPSSATFLRILGGSSVYPTINTSSSSHPGTTMWLALRQHSTTGLAHNWFLNTKADGAFGDVWPLSLNRTSQRSSRGTHVPFSISPPPPQTCRTGLVCSSTLWDGEGFKCGSGGIRGLSVDGGRVIVPEDVQLSWVSVSQHTGYHHPAGKDEEQL